MSCDIMNHFESFCFFVCERFKHIFTEKSTIFSMHFVFLLLDRTHKIQIKASPILCVRVCVELLAAEKKHFMFLILDEADEIYK